MSKKIRIARTPEGDDIMARFSDQFLALTGFEYPPNRSQWLEILKDKQTSHRRSYANGSVKMLMPGRLMTHSIPKISVHLMRRVNSQRQLKL